MKREGSISLVDHRTYFFIGVFFEEEPFSNDYCPTIYYYSFRSEVKPGQKYLLPIRFSDWSAMLG
jgi:hypothetical protein